MRGRTVACAHGIDQGPLRVSVRIRAQPLVFSGEIGEPQRAGNACGTAGESSSTTRCMA